MTKTASCATVVLAVGLAVLADYMPRTRFGVAVVLAAVILGIVVGVLAGVIAKKCGRAPLVYRKVVGVTRGDIVKSYALECGHTITLEWMERKTLPCRQCQEARDNAQ
jgi:hypothetical protein